MNRRGLFGMLAGATATVALPTVALAAPKPRLPNAFVVWQWDKKYWEAKHWWTGPDGREHFIVYRKHSRKRAQEMCDYVARHNFKHDIIWEDGFAGTMENA